MSRWWGMVVVAWGASAGACGGGEPATSAAADEVPDTPPVVDDREPAAEGDEFAVTFTGRDLEMNARAELQVNEGEREVHLSITGRTPGTDVIVIDLTFDGLEKAFGTHSVEFSLPEGGPHDVNGSLDGDWYYSQSGAAELEISAEGRLEGHFEISLARADETQAGPFFEFKPSVESTPLLVTFSVPWVLSCHSRLAGHGVLTPGGDFCDDLEL